ncbi:MAG: NADH:flavin oxidoreductase/NADH oxidase [Candidatus Brocadiae bacterium]|nr:NADH:flavin oxidoreductase/NADH oxidase [Candidatus Brocadiia bacterium]
MPPQLFTPFTLRSLTLPNRLVVSPMCQYSAVDGVATDWHPVHLGQFALGGAGLVWVEATGVEPRGRISPACLGLWGDAHERALEPVVAFFRRQGTAKLGIQLAHAGRKASTDVPWRGGKAVPPGSGGWEPCAPSPLPYDTGWPSPRGLSAEGLKEVRDAFAGAARRAVRAGFDAIELHMAHGYLLHQFLSPLSNFRADGYGGSRERRMLYPLEVFDAVRQSAPDLPVGVRVSATDWAPGGWDLESTAALALELKARGCDFIDVSSGGLTPLQKIEAKPGYQAPFAAEIRRRTGLPVIAVGLITTPAQAETIVSSGQADLVAMARAWLDDPHWGLHAAKELGGEGAWPRQYLRAKR